MVNGSFSHQTWQLEHQLVANTNQTQSVQKRVNGGSLNLTIDLASGGSPQYDAIGNVTRIRKQNANGVWVNQTFEYQDLRFPSLPTKITQCSVCDANGFPVSPSTDTNYSNNDFRYNLQAQRIYRRTQSYDSGEPDHIRDETKHFLPIGTENVAEWNGKKLDRAYLFSGQNRIGYKSKNIAALYVKDYLGSTKLTLGLYRQTLTEALQLKIMESDPFGVTRREVYSAEASQEPHGFTGQEKEAGLDLYYFGQRYYFPDLGRFISVDPAREFDNPYSYVGNNPLLLVDPTGGESTGEILENEILYHAGQGNHVRGFLLTFAKVSWDYLGAESTSRLYDRHVLSGNTDDITGWDYAGAVLEWVGLKGSSALFKGGKQAVSVGGEVVVTTLKQTPPPPVTRLIPEEAADDFVIEAYGTLSKNKEIAGQAHHLNQAAAYRDVIPFYKGMSIKLLGNIFKDAKAAHTLAHAALENFWNKFRGTTIVPTNLEFTKALADSLRAAGLAEEKVRMAVRAAIKERVNFNLLGGEAVPRVPGEIKNIAQ